MNVQGVVAEVGITSEDNGEIITFFVFRISIAELWVEWVRNNTSEYSLTAGPHGAHIGPIYTPIADRHEAQMSSI